VIAFGGVNECLDADHNAPLGEVVGRGRQRPHRAPSTVTQEVEARSGSEPSPSSMDRMTSVDFSRSFFFKSGSHSDRPRPGFSPFANEADCVCGIFFSPESCLQTASTWIRHSEIGSSRSSDTGPIAFDGGVSWGEAASTPQRPKPEIKGPVDPHSGLSGSAREHLSAQRQLRPTIELLIIGDGG